MNRVEQLQRLVEHCASNAQIEKPLLEVECSERVWGCADIYGQGKGKITVSSALLCDDWQRVKFVVAHEIGHLRHGLDHRPRKLNALPLLSVFSAATAVWVSVWFSESAFMIGMLSVIAVISFIAALYLDPEKIIAHKAERAADAFAVQLFGMSPMRIHAAHCIAAKGYDKACRSHPSWEQRLYAANLSAR